MASDVRVESDAIRVGSRFSVAFQRTLRVPEDQGAYPLPPGLGRFPVIPVDELRGPVPQAWREFGGVIIPMYQREALWLAFDGAEWKPNAVQVFVGHVNAVSGGGWTEGLLARPQNYLVCPDQPWLDGINAGEGFIRQFVAMPLGLGYTVEAQLTDAEEVGGIQIRVYEAKPRRFPDQPPERPTTLDARSTMAPMVAPGMGLAAGGRIRQKIYPDPYGIDSWDQEQMASVRVHIVNSAQYEQLTGRPPPPSPVSAATYTEHGLPWFDLYDETMGTVASSADLERVQSVDNIESERGTGKPCREPPLHVDPSQVRRVERDEPR